MLLLQDAAPRAQPGPDPGCNRGGAEVQARPWLESTRFQTLIAKSDKQCFQLEPLCCLSLHLLQPEGNVGERRVLLLCPLQAPRGEAEAGRDNGALIPFLVGVEKP